MIARLALSSWRPLAAAPVLALLLVATSPAATGPLELRADDTLADRVALRVTATNRESVAIEDVRPEAAFAHETHRGERVATLAPGEAHVWTFVLPPPPGPGTFAVTVRAPYRIAGRTGSALLVHTLATPGAPSDPAETALAVEPVAGYGHARLTIDNPTDRGLVGRVIVLLPPALDTEPESRPVQVAGRARTEVPFDVRDQSAAPGETYPLFVLFEYETDGVHHAAVREGALVVGPTAHPTLRPLVVGGLALLVAVALLFGALRHTRRTTSD